MRGEGSSSLFIAATLGYSSNQETRIPKIAKWPNRNVSRGGLEMVG